MNSGFDMFQNSGYVNNRNRKRTLVLDVDDSATGDTHLGAGGEFNIQLFEPLIIDKHSEVYLDNFLSFNSNAVSFTLANCAFVLKINEFNMNSNVASSSDNNNIFNSLVIPNEHKTVENNHSVIIHKGKKFNYVCDINPQTIHSLSGKITNLAGSPIFHGPDPDHKFTYTIIGIDTGKLSHIILNNSTFAGMTGATISGGGSVISGRFLAHHLENANEIHFSTDTQIESIEAGGSGTDVTFTTYSIAGTPLGGGTLTINNALGGTNTGLTLIQNAGRFIAEFSIISRE
tara:strand:+ start:212 stop:1075 length:864 start_codon:yes stop_codon:yes gene_type:complete